MANQEPTAEPMYDVPDAAPLPWSEATDRLTGAGTHWLATVRPDGRPHVVPLGAVWWEGAVYFTSGQGTRKRANLAQNPHCVITFSNQDFDVIIEGDAALLRDDAKLQHLAEVYTAQGWPATAKDGALDAPYSAPTTGPAPYDVYEMTPTGGFALGTTEETVKLCTRYRF
jgi:general stress protein 26